jgi:hypothetical protein
MRCFGGSPGKATLTVAAGDTLGFVASSGIMHFGPCLFYMAKVPEGQDINTWEAAGDVWFKAGSISAIETGGPMSGSEATWPAYRTSFLSTSIRSAPLLTSLESQTRHKSASRSPLRCPVDNIWFASRASPCTWRRTPVAPSYISAADRSTSRAEEMVPPARWSHSRVHTSPLIPV